jgi:hypothetical protein
VGGRMRKVWRATHVCLSSTTSGTLRNTVHAPDIKQSKVVESSIVSNYYQCVGILFLPSNTCFKTIQDDVGLLRGSEGDTGFSSVAIRNFCNDNNTRLNTSVANEEHISNGSRLGLLID